MKKAKKENGCGRLRRGDVSQTPRQIDGDGKGKKGGGRGGSLGKEGPGVEAAAAGRVATSLDGAAEQDWMFRVKGLECDPNMEGSGRRSQIRRGGQSFLQEEISANLKSKELVEHILSIQGGGERRPDGCFTILLTKSVKAVFFFFSCCFKCLIVANMENKSELSLESSV